MTTTPTPAAQALIAVSPQPPTEEEPPDSADAATLDIRGCQLNHQEAAAVVAVIARLAATEPVANDTGGTGPTDRADQRSHRLQSDQHGIWGRPGPSSWQVAGGLR